MANLTKYFRFFIKKKMEEDVIWKQCKVIFSGQEVIFIIILKINII